MSIAYQEGYNEGLEGMDERNPYPVGSDEAMDFYDGYEAGLDEFYDRENQ